MWCRYAREKREIKVSQSKTACVNEREAGEKVKVQGGKEDSGV